MTGPQQTVPATVDCADDAGDSQRTSPAHGRLRLALHGALLAIAMTLALTGYAAWQGERGRVHDAELINLAGTQRMLSQRLVVLSTRPSGDDGGAALGQALARSKREAARLDVLLDAGDAPGLARLPAALSAAVARWHGARKRLWSAAEALVHTAVAGPAADALRPDAAARLPAEADATLAAAQELVAEIQRQAEDRSAAALQRLSVAVAVGVALLLALALGAVEPATRRLQQQHLRMTRQAEQLTRLALVASRTQNVVIVTDAGRRVVWANDAFVRLTGYTLAEALHRKPGELLQTQATDPATVARMRAAMDAERGVRVELLNRSKAGRDYWLDIDVQPLHDADGALSGFLAVETDITEQVFQRQRLRALLDALPTGVVEQCAATGAIIEANQAAEHVLGLSRGQLLGRLSIDERWRTVREDLSPYPGDQHPSARSMRDGVSVRGDTMGVVTPQGEQRWLLVNSEPLRSPAGAVTGAVTCFVDVTEQRAQRALLQLTLQAAGIGTWEWRLDTGERQWNEASCRMLGFSVQEFAPQLPTWRDRIHPEDRPVIEGLLQRHLADPATPYRCDMRVRHRDGHWVWVQAFGAVVDRDALLHARRLVGVHIDVSERKQHEEVLRASALADTLTGLPNRAAVLQRLQAVIAQRQHDPQRHFGVLFLDFDRFKQVNDSLGHAAGDELLRQIARRLEGTVRPGDAVGRDGGSAVQQTAARLGGDEFVVLLEGLQQPGDARAVAERLLQVLARPYDVKGRRVHSTASIGVVTSDHPFDDADSLLRDADTAMYEAKQTGRGRSVVFEPRMHEKVTRRASVEADLHDALERDEIFVVYQPVLSLDSDGAQEPGCAGVEALVRWRHPRRGMVPPLQFIPVAEECGLIGALGRFVLETSCRQFMRWQSDLGAGAPAMLAVNLSIAQLRQPDLVSQVLSALASCAMPAAALQLEVTESLAAQDPLVQAQLRELKALGIQLALDDFGTGYSSLSCLHQLPVDTVKIDRSFVVEAVKSQYHRALIDATVRVARTLRMSTVAEGIETAEQAALVAALGCDRGQGYLYSKPLDSDALVAWLAARGSQEAPHSVSSRLEIASAGAVAD